MVVKPVNKHQLKLKTKSKTRCPIHDKDAFQPQEFGLGTISANKSKNEHRSETQDFNSKNSTSNEEIASKEKLCINREFFQSKIHSTLSKIIRKN